MSKIRKFLAISFIFTLFILACARTANISPPPSGSLPLGETDHTLTYGGRERSYILYAPNNIDWSQPISLVFVFHGGTGNAESAIRMSGFNDIAEQNGFLVVYPNGTGRLSDDKLLTWNGGNCCGYAQEKNVDDVGFVRSIVTNLQSSVNIDSKRIYATGMSNGGIMSYRLACEASDLVAAIAPVSGTLNFSPCNPVENVSVINFHGTADQHIPYEGGFGPQSLVDVDFASVQDSLDFWISLNQCSSQPQTDLQDTIQHDIWSECENQSAVELYTIIGGGHAWPGGQVGWPDGDSPTEAISASQLIWDFFSTHPKP